MIRRLIMIVNRRAQGEFKSFSNGNAPAPYGPYSHAQQSLAIIYFLPGKVDATRTPAR
jgi:hypothetical protein